MPEPPLFVDRKDESRRLKNAVMNRESLMILGPAGIGKTALAANVIASLPAGLKGRCLEIHGAKDFKDLLRRLIDCLHKVDDKNLGRQLHAEGVSARTFAPWLKGNSSSRLKGTLYRAFEAGDYRVFLDHVPPLTKPMASVLKEMFWMRGTPIYLLLRGDPPQRIDRLRRFFYWGEREQFNLQPLPAEAAAELLRGCIERFGLAHYNLTGFEQKVLELSRQVPGAIVRMCALAAEPRYHFGSQIKIKSVYIDSLMSRAPGMERVAG